MAFRFDPIKHEYWLDSMNLPSPTGILKALGTIDDRFFNDSARIRGTAVHAACHYLAEGDLDLDSLDPAIVGYVRAYEAAVKQLNFKPTECETPIHSETLLFACTPDQVGTIGELDMDAIVELKTGSMQTWTAIQTAFQAIAKYSDGYLLVDRIGLELHEDGTFKIERFTDPNDFNVAISMLNVYNYKLNHGGLNGR